MDPEARDTTLSEPICARFPVRPSVIPSPRYVLSGLLERSWNGSTATALTAPSASPRIVRPATSHHAVAASTTMPNVIAGRECLCHAKRLGGVVALMDTVLSRDSSAFRNSWTEPKRSAGSFAMAWWIAASTAFGTV